MIQLEQHKNDRIHWKFIPLTDNLIKAYKDITPAQIEELFDLFKKEGELDKKIYQRKKGIKFVILHLNNLYALAYSQKNYDETYHGLFFVSDDKNALNDLKNIIKAFSKVTSDLIEKAKAQVIKGMN